MHNLSGRCGTARIFTSVGNIHDLESFVGQVPNSLALNALVFTSHWGHLAIIAMWVAGNLYHIGWSGNYDLWVNNPIASQPIAHGVWDPNFSGTGVEDYSVVTYSGLYHWMYSVGFTSSKELYGLVLGLELLSLVALVLGKLHLSYLDMAVLWLANNRPKLVPSSTGTGSGLSLDVSKYQVTTMLSSYLNNQVLAYMSSNGIRLNYHLAVLIGFSSILWAGHQVHVSVPVSRGAAPGLIQSIGLTADSDNHISRTAAGAGNAILTFQGGLDSATASLQQTDMAHHHLAVGVLFVWAGHLYTSLYKGLGHRIRNIIVSSNMGLLLSGQSIAGLTKSLQLQLGLALGGLAAVTCAVATQMYSLPPYAFMSYDYVTTVVLYIHHCWIASFLAMGAFAHLTIYMIRDYVSVGYTTATESLGTTCVIRRLMLHKSAIISHLSWVTLWLGFHTLGVYIHNDTVVAFSEADAQILIEPVLINNWLVGADFASQSSVDKGNLYKAIAVWRDGLTPGDFMLAHAVSLGLHTTVLILIKGALDASGSKLMPDKVQFGYGFACDGPGRGGTCDISAWDAFYLAFFWMLNTNAWNMFYFHWKHLLFRASVKDYMTEAPSRMLIKQNSVFDESSTYLNGWFRDYLWFNSGDLIRGYDPLGANDLAVWAWLFLAAHLCWATSFMFLISWRGYWQELIDIIIYMHLKTPILYDIWNAGVYTPMALSIVQARFIGLVHYAVGFILTYAAFVIGSTS